MVEFPELSTGDVAFAAFSPAVDEDETVETDEEDEEEETMETSV